MRGAGGAGTSSLFIDLLPSTVPYPDALTRMRIRTSSINRRQQVLRKFSLGRVVVVCCKPGGKKFLLVKEYDSAVS